MNPPEPPVIPSPERRRRMIFIKLAGIGALILLLQIPLILTNGVLSERREYQRQATEEIAGVWGREQRITGPVLAVPYVFSVQVTRDKVVAGILQQVEETESRAAIAYFLPETLTADAPVETEVRHRGIYDAVVYSAKVRLSGVFQPDFAAAGIEADRVDWTRACVLFGVSDLRGLRSVSPLLTGGGQASPFESAGGGDQLPAAARRQGRDTDPGGESGFLLRRCLAGKRTAAACPGGEDHGAHD